MSAISQPLTPPLRHLRPFDVGKDLNSVADLVEACFAETLDEDGRRYVEQMRSAARNPRYLRWATTVADHVSMPLNGYIWEEDGALVGNLSLIPFINQGKRNYLIANVAVAPNYRRRGIARALTEKAMQHARDRGADAVWLHVREENPPAIHLYESMGFKERARRTTWEYKPNSKLVNPLPGQPDTGIALTPRAIQHWPQQRAWLKRLYPPELTWHLPFNLRALQPGPIGSLYRFFTDTPIQQWSASQGDDLLGVLTWQPHTRHADHLWLASTPEKEEQAISPLLSHARTQLAGRYRLILDYPAGRARQAMLDSGLRIQQTLIWMEVQNMGQTTGHDRYSPG
jgi:ribosomal protein S18 acetylase RimI-like enzyme